MRSRVLMVAASTVVLVVINGNGLPIAAQGRASAKPDMLAVQVMLDRARFSPGEIDGKGGPNTVRAIEAFERAKGTTAAEAVTTMGVDPVVAYTITADDEVGYVGTTGNAPQDTPHLHFAIFQMTDKKEWWQGTPIDPYKVLR